MQKKIEKIKEFLKKEVKKRGFQNIVFGLSGGIDSAVVGYFCNEVFKDRAKAFIMPSFASNAKNTTDAINFARSIGLYYEVIDINNIAREYINTLNLEDNKTNMHRIGNVFSRIRMSILYDKSFLHNALVVGCSNKSELMLGYGTIHGDLAYAINPIGDIFKSEIFELARIIRIPNNIINKKPSADLYIGQSDEAELGYTYTQIDELLKKIEEGYKQKELIEAGFQKEFVKSIFKRVKKNRFKTEYPKIAKIPSITKNKK